MHSGQPFHLPYVRAFDGLRGVAVAAVVVFHAGQFGSGPAWLQGGFIGVDVFFALSGFLITALLLEELEQRGRLSLRNFYARRALRLGPALLVVLATLLVVALATDRGGQLHATAVAITFTSNWYRALGLGELGNLGHTWSLAIEEQFYLLWPLVLAATVRCSPSRLLAVALGLAALAWAWRIDLLFSGATIDRVYNGLDTRADALMLGCALAIAVSSGTPSVGKRVPAVIAWTSIATLVVLAIVGRPDSIAMAVAGYAIVSCASTLLIVHLLTNDGDRVTRLLSWRPIVWTGQISYGVYLWHYPVFATFSDHGHAELVWPVGIPLTLLLAGLTFYTIERRVLGLRRRLRRTPVDAHSHPASR